MSRAMRAITIGCIGTSNGSVTGPPGGYLILQGFNLRTQNEFLGCHCLVNTVCDFASNRLELGLAAKQGENWFSFAIPLFLIRVATMRDRACIAYVLAVLRCCQDPMPLSNKAQIRL